MLAPYASEMVDGVPTTVTAPEIAVVVFIPSGFSGGEASMAAREFVGWYMDQKTLRDNQNSVFPGRQPAGPVTRAGEMKHESGMDGTFRQGRRGQEHGERRAGHGPWRGGACNAVWWTQIWAFAALTC